jgi:hypothetical protein
VTKQSKPLPSLRGPKQSRVNKCRTATDMETTLIDLDCFVPRNDDAGRVASRASLLTMKAEDNLLPLSFSLGLYKTRTVQITL